tara:strand:- start:8089 stop:9099 length:1011 start_codon:yes stop_codon:yes gene_type:complete
MSLLLAGLPVSVTGTTVNRLCGSSLDATAIAARAIKSGETDLMIAGGVESMSRAPFVMGKAGVAFSRNQTVQDTTIGWRFINPLMKANFGVDSMPETAENVAMEFKVSREDQDTFALQSQQRTAQAKLRGFLAEEIIPVSVPQRRGDPIIVEQDEHPRSNTQLEQLSILRPIVKVDGTVTAGNASGVNDGAVALLLASDVAVKQYGLTPIVKIITTTTAGVEPRIMGFGPAPAVQKLLAKTRLTTDKIAVFEINEAFAAQVLAVNRNLGLSDNDERVNPNGGAIALGHPLGASGARLIMSAAHQLRRSGQRYAICALCIGVGQGMAMLLENAVYSG